MTRLGNVASISLDDPEYFEILGGLWTGKKPPFTKAGVIRNTNFTASGEIDYSDVAWLDVEVKQLAKRQLKQGDIVIERSGGGPRQPVGRVVQFRRSDGMFSFSNFTTAVRVKKPDELEPLFAFYVLLELYQSGRTDDIQRRTIGLRNLDFKAYRERAIFPLISIYQQRRIAYVLATVQTAIEQQARLIALTRELKSALVHKLFTEGLRGEKQKETEIGLVPESWEVVELEQVSEKPQYGFTESAQDKGTAQFLRITDIHDFGVSWADVPFCECPENLIKTYLLKSGDLVFARIGATTGKSFVINNPPKAVFASYLIRIRPFSGKLDSGFLGYYCQTNQYWQQIDAHKGNNLKGGVNSGILQKLLVPLPKTSEQQEISQVFTALDNKINLAQKTILLLEELFRSLLHQLMTGQVRV